MCRKIFSPVSFPSRKYRLRAPMHFSWSLVCPRSCRAHPCSCLMETQVSLGCLHLTFKRRDSVACSDSPSRPRAQPFPQHALPSAQCHLCWLTKSLLPPCSFLTLQAAYPVCITSKVSRAWCLGWGNHQSVANTGEHSDHQTFPSPSF